MWGTAFPFIKVGYSAFKIEESDIGSKLIFAGMRFMLAGFMVFLFVDIKKKLPTLSKKDILLPRLFTRSGSDRIAVYFYIHRNRFYKRNEHLYNNGLCVVLYRTFRAVVFQNDRLTPMKIIGCILGFGGIIAINFGGTVSTDTWFGDMMILFSTISAAAGNIVAKKVTTGRDPFPVTAFQLLTGGFILLVSGICCGGSIGLINVESVSVLLWLAFVSAAAFFSLWTALLKFHDASRISVFNLLVPVFGTVLSGLMLGENVFRIETLISLILISLGIAFVNMNLKNREVKYES